MVTNLTIKPTIGYEITGWNALEARKRDIRAGDTESKMTAEQVESRAKLCQVANIIFKILGAVLPIIGLVRGIIGLIDGDAAEVGRGVAEFFGAGILLFLADITMTAYRYWQVNAPAPKKSEEIPQRG